MTRPFGERDSTPDAQDDAYRRQRIQWFLLVMLSIDVVAYVSDYVSPLLIDGLTMPDYPMSTHLARHSATTVVATGWAVARFGRPGRRGLAAIEGGVTLWLSLVYARVATSHMTAEEAAYAPIFAMFGLLLLLSVRAALVPSPAFRTVVIGSVSMIGLFTVARDAVTALAPRVFEGVAFIGGAFVIATGVTSHVIYGLRRDVRRALRLGQYVLGARLGEGGMGTVFLARHALLRRSAAIKLIRPELIAGDAGRDEAIQRFQREADVTASLRSPHTVELYDFGIADDGSFYYVMELLDGITLEQAVTRHGPMPPARAVYILRQVCESLDEAHAAGLVHRDIKPANILLCRYGRRHDFVKVLDFGLVALAPGAGATRERLSADTVAAGTPAYLAPETVTRLHPVDERTDLYAVGCVAFWLLTGRLPFERPTAMATILAHVNDPPSPPSSLSPRAVPPILDALVLACLSKDPGGRPPSAAALSARLSASVDRADWGEPEADAWWTTHAPTRSPAEPAEPARTVGSRVLTVGVSTRLR